MNDLGWSPAGSKGVMEGEGRAGETVDLHRGEF